MVRVFLFEYCGVFPPPEPALLNFFDWFSELFQNIKIVFSSQQICSLLFPNFFVHEELLARVLICQTPVE